MREQIFAQVILDIAAGVENDEARKPARDPPDQRHRDHHYDDPVQSLLRRQAQACKPAESLRMMRLDRVYRGSAEKRDAHAAR